MLSDHQWRLKYTPDGGDLVRLFYVPALEDAERYDRLTGYFSAGALALAARGIEGLVRNNGRMRLIVGCTLDDKEIQAIEEGEALREQVERRLSAMPLVAPDAAGEEALELLSWMVANDHLDVKVAVPCDANGKPVQDGALFHEKSGIVQDRAGDRIAWTGSLNETAAGWRYNWESISVYTSWGPEPARVDAEEANFARLWSKPEGTRFIVLDVPDAVRQDLMRFMPKDIPARLKESGEPAQGRRHIEATPPSPQKPPTRGADLRSLVWHFIAEAPKRANGGERVGEATAAVTPWPHQVRAFDRLYARWPPKLLIADEVGLGKTIQAGMLLRQAWLSGRAKRILVLAPKAVLRQWQIELREKFNLNWPIYDGRRLVRYPSRALRGRHERQVARREWHTEPIVIASSHLMRRRDRAGELLEDAEPWDLVVLDEAHHARRRGAGSQSEGGPNALLRLMSRLKERTQGLVLLTATPMQVHPIEVWDLLNLLGLPREWSAKAFLDFFEDAKHPNPSHEAMARMATLFRATERQYGVIGDEDAAGITGESEMRTRRILRPLRDRAKIPLRQLSTDQRADTVRLMRAYTPLRHLISRHTRELLRRYRDTGKLAISIADRDVSDEHLAMSALERELYDAVEGYISTTYNQASEKQRSAVGFVMTTYRRRLASSVAALRVTLERHHAAIVSGEAATADLLADDVPDDEAGQEVFDTDELAELEREALASEERADIESLLARIARCPPDSKLARLRETLDALRLAGYEQIMVFTQYGDTMDFLRDALLEHGKQRLLCYSGRGGEVASEDGGWRSVERDEVKRLFRESSAEILLCTDAAAEGLNFQFCGALVNYDMPWNPMRVEQRIGRIDRLGQRYDRVRIVNLHYEDTVESDVYAALRERIGSFESVVGRLQPILSRLPGTITSTVLAGSADERGRRASLEEAIDEQLRADESAAFDIDAVVDDALTMPDRPKSPVTMDDLDRVIGTPDLMPNGIQIRRLSAREYALRAPGTSDEIRVTTKPEYYEAHSQSLELWSPGSPLFSPPDLVPESDEISAYNTLHTILLRLR